MGPIVYMKVIFPGVGVTPNQIQIKKPDFHSSPGIGIVVKIKLGGGGGEAREGMREACKGRYWGAHEGVCERGGMKEREGEREGGGGRERERGIPDNTEKIYIHITTTGYVALKILWWHFAICDLQGTKCSLSHSTFIHTLNFILILISVDADISEPLKAFNFKLLEHFRTKSKTKFQMRQEQLYEVYVQIMERIQNGFCKTWNLYQSFQMKCLRTFFFFFYSFKGMAVYFTLLFYSCSILTEEIIN